MNTTTLILAFSRIFWSGRAASEVREQSVSRYTITSFRNWAGDTYKAQECCCCLPCNHCRRSWTWVVEEILAFGNRLRSTHCREFNYLKLCRPAYFVRTTQLLHQLSIDL